MSNFNQLFSNEEELTSPSSDEKMDTGSESFRSQGTPNSMLSSDFEDNPEQNVLRLQNAEILRTPEVFKNLSEAVKDQKSLQNLPSHEVLRLSGPDDHDDSFKKMSLSTPKESRPQILGISPPKFSSTLTLTTNHPLMGLGSPEEYPDLIPKKLHKIEDEKDLSFSSIEDERTNDTNGFYSPQRNTSKNNLYFTENFVTAESHILADSYDLPPDVARVVVARRKIKPTFEGRELTPHTIVTRDTEENKDGIAWKLSSHSTPKCCFKDNADVTEQFHSGVAEWCESPSHTVATPNFDLPIEMSTNVGTHNDLESPDVISTSTQEEKSAYQALLDPYTGSVALRHTAPRSKAQQAPQRRIIKVPQEDSISVSSFESEEEPPPPEPLEEPLEPEMVDEHPDTQEDALPMSDDDSTKRSKSTNTISYTSEPIPEYSVDEELSNERRWVSVHSHACDVKVIEPYKRVLSHGGYSSAGAALIVFSACHLPDNKRHDYTYVMDNLFLYVIWSLERLVTDEYVLVYLHGSAGRRRMPAFHWLHECYKLIDRRLRKRLKHLYLVHPTFWLKSFVFITKPFVSSKFLKKMSYVNSLEELLEKVPVDTNAIPELVKQYDATRKR